MSTRNLFYKRHLLGLINLTPTELLALAADLKQAKKQGWETRHLLGKKHYAHFRKNSTRTRCAFDVAAFDQGAQITYLSPSGNQIGHKEGSVALRRC